MTDLDVAIGRADSADMNVDIQSHPTLPSPQIGKKADGTSGLQPEKRTVTWNELVSGDLTPVDWLVDRLIPAEGVVVVGGDSGVGKSWLALHIAHCVATGKPVLGKFATSRGSVCFVDEENSTLLLKRRVQKLAAGSQASEDTPVTFLVQHQVRIDRPDNLAKLVGLIAQEKPKLIIFDSFIRIHGSNENDSREMAEVMAKMRDLRNRLGCAIVFTHHTRKRSMINVAGQMLRGSTDIRAFVDAHLFVRLVRGPDKRIRIEHEKSRYCEAVHPFEITIADNEEGTATYLRYLGEGRAPKPEKREIAKKMIPQLLAEEGPMARKDIIERCKAKVGSRNAGEALVELAQDAVLTRQTGPRNQHIYSLAKTP